MRPEFYKGILDNLFDGVYFVNRQRCITYWNRSAERISGYRAEEVLGKSCASNILRHITAEGKELCNDGCPLTQTLDNGLEFEGQVFLQHKDGHRVPVAVRVSPLRDDEGAIVGAVELFSDASSHLRMICELNELKSKALTDALTGLGNRNAAGQEFKRRLGELKRHGTPFGLLFADVDGFKIINDTHGHDTGDKALVLVAKTLQSALRGVDTVCRWGGEEFVVLVPQVEEQIFYSIAERMRRFVEVSPLRLNGESLSITVSVGGAMARPEDTLTSLAARADAMMYAAKRAGRNCTRIDCTGDATA